VFVWLVKLERSVTDIYRMLQQVFGKRIMSRMQVFVCVKQFQGGKEDIIDDRRSICPTTCRSDL